MIIYPDRVDSSWWRDKGHFLQMDDLREVIAARTEVIIIGTGYSGAMKVSDEIISNLKLLKIDVHVATTIDAVKLFNELSGKRKALACLHLTC